MQLDALLRLAFATAPSITELTLLHKVTRRLIMQKVRGHSGFWQAKSHRTPTACRYMVSGTISLPSQGFFSPFPHGTGSLSVISEYLALENGLPRFPQDFSCPVVLRYLVKRDHFFSPTGLSPSMVSLSRTIRLRNGFVTLRALPFQTPTRPYNPRGTTQTGYHVPPVWALPLSFATT